MEHHAEVDEDGDLPQGPQAPNRGAVAMMQLNAPPASTKGASLATTSASVNCPGQSDHMGTAAATTAPAQRHCSVWELITGPEATHWRQVLVQDHLDSAARLALFSCSTDAMDTVLGAAERASMGVPDVSYRLEQFRHRFVGRALATRGKRRTQTLGCSLQDLTPTLGLLAGSITWLDALHVQVSGGLVSASELATIGSSCPNLRVLVIGKQDVPAPAALPSPTLFPHLKELSINGTLPADLHQQQCLLSSTAPYLTQLTLLTLPDFNKEHTAVQDRLLERTAIYSLLNPDNIGTHLRTLHLNRAVLDDTLLGLILHCAPATEQLTVQGVWLMTDTHAHAQHKWQQLQFTDSWVLLSHLAKLPLAPGLELVCNAECLDVDSDMIHVCCDITEAAVAARLQGVRVSLVWPDDWEDRWEVVVDTPYYPDQQPVALRVGLGVLRAWTMSGGWSIMAFNLGESWEMSGALMREVQGLPQCLEVLFWDMPWRAEGPEVYAPLLGLLPGGISMVGIVVSDLPDEVVAALCLGAPRTRTAATPLRIELFDCEPELLQDIQHRMQVVPHVTVVHGVNNNAEAPAQ